MDYKYKLVRRHEGIFFYRVLIDIDDYGNQETIGLSCPWNERTYCGGTCPMFDFHTIKNVDNSMGVVITLRCKDIKIQTSFVDETKPVESR